MEEKKQTRRAYPSPEEPVPGNCSWMQGKYLYFTSALSAQTAHWSLLHWAAAWRSWAILGVVWWNWPREGTASSQKSYWSHLQWAHFCPFSRGCATSTWFRASPPSHSLSKGCKESVPLLPLWYKGRWTPWYHKFLQRFTEGSSFDYPEELHIVGKTDCLSAHFHNPFMNVDHSQCLSLQGWGSERLRRELFLLFVRPR